MLFYKAWLHVLLLSFHLSSAWIQSDNIYDYVQYKNKFSSMNGTKKFVDAIQQADERLAQQNENLNVEVATKNGESSVIPSSSNDSKITVKNIKTSELLRSFKEHESILRSIFNERKKKLERFNYGNGYDFLTILSRTATPEQQKQMYSHICVELVGQNYYDRPIFENLFWSIILPEWLIAICMKKFSCSKEHIIAQIKQNDEDSFNAKNASFLSFE